MLGNILRIVADGVKGFGMSAAKCGSLTLLEGA
jgi:hypothetical protein